ncbi:MAG TPA: bifunctional lysylphosphatidylglycerol flippase/synthetase MprF [Gemmatimonadaceae bacterium]|nr:bifunctional lysylphosphatidylglycerol flippase/synthetase MprF [Gemmatimonadaceae bacterium]
MKTPPPPPPAAPPGSPRSPGGGDRRGPPPPPSPPSVAPPTATGEREAIVVRPDDEARDAAEESRLARLARYAWPVLALALFAVAMTALRHELHEYRYRDVVAALKATPRSTLVSALLFTIAGYLTLPGYDALALRYVKRPLSARQTMFASFITYAVSQTVGLSVLTGGSIRFRFWSAWGLTPGEIARGVAFSTATFWLGVVAMTGAALVAQPAAATAAIPTLSPLAARAAGAALLAIVALYLAWATVVRRPVVVGAWTFAPPPPPLALGQIVVASADWALAAAVLYALLPDPTPIGYVGFIGIFLVAQVAGLVSHVPGGLGVFETVIVLLLRPYTPPEQLLAALVAYRAVYYLFPFGAALLMLGAYEAARRSSRLTAAVQLAGRWVPAIAPQLLAAATFLAGALLLFSGATPSVKSRMNWLDDFLPLAAVEISHFVASLTGVGLLVLARGLQRRLDAAYGLAVSLLVVGVVSSLLKGADFEEATVLAIVLAVLLPSHRYFYRRAALTEDRFTPRWIAAIALVVGASIWLGLFSFKHVAYSSDLWWQFEFRRDAPRFLRATVGVVAGVLFVAMSRLLRPAPPEPELPTPEEIERAVPVVRASSDSDAALALLGDKALLFSDSGRGLIMYGHAGRSWVALGDPLGPPAERAELAWRFREMADRHGGWTVFYQVSHYHLPLYVDLGLTLLKLGEQARVPLERFSLDGGGRKGMRRVINAMQKEGATFEVLPPDAVRAHLPELRAVSDAWLEEKHTREKGFSLGFFDDAYVARFPAGVVRRDGRIVAFANVLATDDRCELSVDLMRYAPGAPPSAMEYLFLELLLWGKAERYEWMNLGMAPLSGLDSRALAPRWNRLGALVYRHGEHFYNFRGLRTYKEKFDPVWVPRYLASPAGLSLPRVLANVAALISGGLRGVVAR